MDDVLPPLTYAPDGLYESDIDALIAEYFTEMPHDVVEHRRTRRLSRQTVNAALRGYVVEPIRVDDAAA
jgi:hypothetical protein